MSLVTLAKYKEYLKITDTTVDTQLTTLTAHVEQRVKTWLNRAIESATYTDEYYNGNGKHYLVLRQFPITAATTIKVYDGLDSNNAEIWTTLVQGTDYERKVLDTEACSVYLDGYTFEKGLQNYKITYTAGYTSIPEDIQLACKELLKVTWDNSPLNQNRLGFTSVSDSAGSSNQNLTLDGEIEMKILKKIEAHRAYNV